MALALSEFRAESRGNRMQQRGFSLVLLGADALGNDLAFSFSA